MSNKIDYYRTRKAFTPEIGKVYENEGGGMYLCIDSGGFANTCDGRATMMNTKSFWCMEANGCGIYEDGKIDWDYSTNGRFVHA